MSAAEPAELMRRYAAAIEQYDALAKALRSDAPPSVQALQSSLERWFCSSLPAAPVAALPWPFADAAAILAQLQALMERGIDYQRAQTRLADYWTPVARGLAAEFAQAAHATAQRGDAAQADHTQAEAMSDWYARWVDSAEAAYSQAAHRPEYAALLAALTDAASAYKTHQRALVELWSKPFDQPTRGELDAVHRQLKALHEQLRALRRSLDP